jgi:AmmeMemoRadiSam system protein A
MGKNRPLTQQEGEILLKVARNTIKKELFPDSPDTISKEEIDKDIFKEKRGVFVTINKRGNLRGCIGHIIPYLPLIEGVKENAINAAFKDPRFPPLSKDEFEDIDIEISILTTPTPLKFESHKELLQKLIPFKHGVILKKGINQATFLPQVWEQLPKKENFLTHLCLKAGLPADAWMDRNIEVSTYEVQILEEKKNKN